MAHHFSINNYTAAVAPVGLENGQLPKNDWLYSYFSVQDQKYELWFFGNWKKLFFAIGLGQIQDLAENNWKNRNRRKCINEFISNAENREFWPNWA